MKEVTAMMAGKIVDILVNPGDYIRDGQDLAIIESMKMQIPISSTAGGVVKTIRVAAGEFVNQGDLIIIIE